MGDNSEERVSVTDVAEQLVVNGLESGQQIDLGIIEIVPRLGGKREAAVIRNRQGETIDVILPGNLISVKKLERYLSDIIQVERDDVDDDRPRGMGGFQ